jgi:signal peptidase I
MRSARKLPAAQTSATRVSPFEVSGISMAPWLMPGDVVWVEREFPSASLKLGDLVVMQNRTSGSGYVHRVIRANPLQTKGDRNQMADPRSDDWIYGGRVRRFSRNQNLKPTRDGLLLWALCRFGLYPGQRIPRWLSRSNLRKKLGGHVKTV